MTSFEDNRALVTGASSGIGRAVALRLAAGGATLALCGRDTTRLAAVAAEATALGGVAHTFVADLAAAVEAEKLGASVAATLGGVDTLIHAAGLLKVAPPTEFSIAEYERLMAVNLRAPFVLTQALYDSLRAKGGDVVFVNSSVVNFPRADASLYSATKHGLRGIADCLRQDLNPAGVRVLSIYPGRTATPMQDARFAYDGRQLDTDTLLQADDVAAMVCHALTLPRNAEVTEIHLRPARAG